MALGLAVTLAVVEAAGAAAVEALEADVEAIGVVLGVLAGGLQGGERGGAYDRVEALGAVFAVDGLGGRGRPQVCACQQDTAMLGTALRWIKGDVLTVPTCLHFMTSTIVLQSRALDDDRVSLKVARVG